MESGSFLGWLYEHLLELIELFVVVPIGAVVALLALVVAVPWVVVGSGLAAVGVTVPPLPPALVAAIRWPYEAFRHVFTGDGEFPWTPRT